MFYFGIVLLFLLFSSALAISAPYYDLENAGRHFGEFIEKYNKNYESREEFNKRFQIFKTNLEKINEMNDYYKHKDGGYFISRFADQERIRGCLDTSLRPNVTLQKLKREFIVNAPASIDYRQQNLVSPVKDQGRCMDCYVFAAIENIEGVYAKQTSTLLSLSEQQALDCVASCNPGSPIDVMNNMAKYGCMTEEDYPYVGVQGQCHTDPNKIKVKVTGGTQIDTPDVETLKGALAQNGAPLAVGMYASQELDKYIGKDIINPRDCDGTENPNHAVLLVGYNTDATTGKTFWIIKNSWGTNHGDGGYYYLDVKSLCSFGKMLTSTAIVATTN